MKKILTLIAVAVMTLTANAQTASNDDVNVVTSADVVSAKETLKQRLAVASLVDHPSPNLKGAITYAVDILDTESATEREVIDATDKLNDAILKEPLSKKLGEAQAIEHPSASLKDAIAAATDVIDTAGATQAVIDGALADLEQAMQVATAINKATVAAAQVSKYIENGKVVIVKNGKKFNAAGALLK